MPKAEPPKLKRCPICWKNKQEIDIITLPCNHIVCGLCLSNYDGDFCPEVGCTGGRSTEIIVDEVSGGETLLQMKFGMSTLSMLKLDEKMNCDNVRNQLACNNLARIKLNHCRHNICNDCLSPQIQVAVQHETFPHCPVLFCANPLTSSDLLQWAELSPLNMPSYLKLEKRVPKAVEMSAPQKFTEFNVSVVGQENSFRRIVIPDTCLVADVFIAVAHMERRFLKGKSITEIGFYIREENQNGVSYDRLLPRLLTKLNIKKMEWPKKVNMVIDIENQLGPKK